MCRTMLLFVFVTACFFSSCEQKVNLSNPEEVHEVAASPTPQIKNVDGIPPALTQRLIEDINEVSFQQTEEELGVLYNNLKLELHDLNNDDEPEYFLYIAHHYWCGAGSNCTYWVYRRKDQKFELMLEVKVLKPQKTVTNGYRNLSSETPMGICEPKAWQLYVTRYKFDGEKYQKQNQGEYECRSFRTGGIGG